MYELAMNYSYQIHIGLTCNICYECQNFIYESFLWCVWAASKKVKCQLTYERQHKKITQWLHETFLLLSLLLIIYNVKTLVKIADGFHTIVQSNWKTFAYSCQNTLYHSNEKLNCYKKYFDNW